METTIDRWAPLTGAAAVVLVVAGFAVGGDTPDPDASASEAASYYSSHQDRNIVAALVVSLGAIVLVFFASTLRGMFRDKGAGDRIAAVVFGGGIIATSGFLAAAGIHFALADTAGDIDPVATQTLNAIDGNFFLPFAYGVVVLLLAAGIAILQTRALPVWLAWVAFAVFVVSFTPAGAVAFGVSGLWIIVVSVLLFARGRGALPAPAPAAVTPAAT